MGNTLQPLGLPCHPSARRPGARGHDQRTPLAGGPSGSLPEGRGHVPPWSPPGREASARQPRRGGRPGPGRRRGGDRAVGRPADGPPGAGPEGRGDLRRDRAPPRAALREADDGSDGLREVLGRRGRIRRGGGGARRRRLDFDRLGRPVRGDAPPPRGGRAASPRARTGPSTWGLRLARSRPGRTAVGWPPGPRP
jgi:hypothetical protein